MRVKPGEGVNLLTLEQLEEYHDAFDLYDRDGDGKVTSHELGPLMRCLGANPKEDHLQELMNEVDYDGDGFLNFTEFIDLMINDKPEIDDDIEMIEAFRCFDTENTGFIYSADIREALYHMDEGLSHVDGIIDAANLQEDRQITFDGNSLKYNQNKS
ncbi:calmodulin-like [Xenia sp. Carnegie-2017]|uniref:calmodulin-like n=1 Tax=Xenia sp. Carnegie-2017 TaxID=2897299 RepID=UPI001F04F13A|nr:calmodulin-like [Xenia sp. Carnegie-2017]